MGSDAESERSMSNRAKRDTGPEAEAISLPSARDVDSDEALLAQWAAGVRGAGAELIDRHIQLLQRFFRSKVSPSHTEDLVQQTLLATLEAQARYRREARFSTFLLGIARNVLLTHFDRAQRARSRSIDFNVDSVRDLGTSPTGILARQASERALFDALQSLSVDHQIVLELTYWEDLSGAELADVLGVSPNGAYSRVHRARLALRDALDARVPGFIGPEGGLELLDAWARSLKDHCSR